MGLRFTKTQWLEPQTRMIDAPAGASKTGYRFHRVKIHVFWSRLRLDSSAATCESSDGVVASHPFAESLSKGTHSYGHLSVITGYETVG